MSNNYNNTNYLFVALLFLFVSGCSLTPPPPDRGEKCEKVTTIIDQGIDICKNPGTCDDYQVNMDLGYCPTEYPRCIKKGDWYCRAKCSEENQILCDEKCADPNTWDEHCGARGRCTSSEENDDFAGYDCTLDNRVCQNGECIKPTCKQTQFKDPKTEECIDNTIEHCGSYENVCSSTQVCLGGSCEDSCGNPSQLICHGVCINPNDSTEFCGAEDDGDGHCIEESYQNCGQGGACMGGTCQLAECTDPDKPNLCPNGEERICVNFQTDPETCGSCETNCQNVKHEHTRLLEPACVNGKCQFECIDEGGVHYENCGTASEPVCVDLSKHHLHCGECNNACTGYCDNGICLASSCSSNTVCARNDCQNSQTLCGPNCVDCTEDYHAETATCEDGQCHVTQCKDGYRMIEVEVDLGSGVYENRCEPNTDTVCGKPDEISTGRDCTTIPNANSGTCDHGTCKFTCQSKAHEFEDGCELNDRTHCGKSRSKCPDDTEIYKYSCSGNGNDATCKITGCGEDYYLHNETCARNSLENCGRVGNNCKQITGWSTGECRAGECYATSCTYASGYGSNKKYHAINGKCIRHCISECATSMNNATQCCANYSYSGPSGQQQCSSCETIYISASYENRCLYDITHNYDYEYVYCMGCDGITSMYESDPEHFEETFQFDEYIQGACYYFGHY